MTPQREMLDKLRFLAIGTALHTKGPRTFLVTVMPSGIEIRATDRTLVHALSYFALIDWEQFREMSDGAIRERLNRIDAEIDRELAAAQ